MIYDSRFTICGFELRAGWGMGDAWKTWTATRHGGSGKLQTCNSPGPKSALPGIG